MGTKQLYRRWREEQEYQAEVSLRRYAAAINRLHDGPPTEDIVKELLVDFRKALGIEP